MKGSQRKGNLGSENSLKAGLLRKEDGRNLIRNVRDGQLMEMAKNALQEGSYHRQISKVNSILSTALTVDDLKAEVEHYLQKRLFV